MLKFVVRIGVLLLLLLGSMSWATEFYVATDGMDDPGNGSEQDPFRTITYALSVTDTTDTPPHAIHVAAGLYTINTEIFPLPMIDSITVSGAGPGQTIVDAGSGATNVFTCVDVDNWTLENMTITGGRAIQGGGISVLHGDNITLHNLVISGNRADHPQVPNFEGHGGGLYLYEAGEVVVDHVLFVNNSARDDGGAITITNCAPVLRFLTISRNSTDMMESSNAIRFETNAGHTWLLANSIVWNNGDADGLTSTVTPEGLQASYCLLERDDGDVWPGTGNTWNDPLFTNPENDFTLLPGSWAIDRADPAAEYDNEPAPNGGRANAGFYGNTSNAQLSASPLRLSRGREVFFGLPVETETGDPQELFGDYFDDTTPSDATWRLQRWDNIEGLYLRYDEPEADSVEHGDPPDLEPGLGYLLRQTLTLQDTVWAGGPALNQAVDFEQTFPQSAETQYHMVANPYPYPVNWAAMRLQTPAGLLPFHQAAQLNYTDMYLYILDSQGRYTPTLDRLDPWQGATVVSNRTGEITWIVPSERNTAFPGDITQYLDWVLSAGFAALDTSGATLATDEGHLFGVGELMEDGKDGFDARIIPAPSPSMLTWSQNTVEEEIALYHDLRAPVEQDHFTGWHFRTEFHATGDTVLPDSFVFRVNGFAFDELGDPVYPDTSYRFRLMDGEFTILMDDMRDYPDSVGCEVVVPAEHSEDGSRATAEVWVFAGNQVWVDAEESAAPLPQRFEIRTTWPNPFNRTLSIAFTLPRGGDVQLAVYDVLGREVDRRMHQGLTAGEHRVVWQTGQDMASGVYFLRLDHAGTSLVEKVILLK